jgi:hypothetical protein
MDKHSDVSVALTSLEVKRLNKLRKQVESENDTSVNNATIILKVTVSKTTGIGANVFVEAFKSSTKHAKQQVLKKVDITDYESW